MEHVPARPVDLNRIVQEVVELVTPDMTSRRVAIQQELADNLPLAKGDAVELQQVLLNLLINGAQAMRDTDPDSRLLVVRTVEDNGQLVVSVKDHGIGLDADVERDMFEPFFTTKPSGQTCSMPRMMRSRLVLEEGSRTRAYGWRRHALAF